MKVKCLQCGYEFELESASNDELGWHTTCPKCEGSFDINIEGHLVPNGTKVVMHDGKIGIVDGNDVENSEEFEDINYFICPLEYTHKEVWSNDYVFLLREDFEFCK